MVDFKRKLMGLEKDFVHAVKRPTREEGFWGLDWSVLSGSDGTRAGNELMLLDGKTWPFSNLP
jgi:hypothetical protein